MATTTYYGIGLMSGTSLDGVDLAYCRFTLHGTLWQFDILKAETIPYDDSWMRTLMEAPALTGRELMHLHFSYGRYLGQLINRFIRNHGISHPGIIASHGHTVFHDPDSLYTFQLGHGAAIAAETRLDVVTDFRSTDVAKGGQGAPLVPLGDMMLFGSYAGCINLGGFANISYHDQEMVHAFDICPLNFVINRIVQKASIADTDGTANLMYDRNGDLARKGCIDNALLQELNNLYYYARTGAKSLGEEWVVANIWPVLSRPGIITYDLLRTFYAHVTDQIIRSLLPIPSGDILVSGGGAYNMYLMELIRARMKPGHRLVLPEKKIIEYKESLIFALLGILRLLGQTNCLSSVTGSDTDSCAGTIYAGM